MTICIVDKIDTFDSIWNFIILQWQKNCYFLFTFFFQPSLRKWKNQWWFTTVWYKSNFLKFVFLEGILYINIYYMSPKKAWAPTFWGGGRFSSFYKNIELVARLDSCHQNYAIDEYRNYTIKIKYEFYSEKNYLWCYSNVIKTFRKLP